MYRKTRLALAVIAAIIIAIIATGCAGTMPTQPAVTSSDHATTLAPGSESSTQQQHPSSPSTQTRAPGSGDAEDDAANAPAQATGPQSESAHAESAPNEVSALSTSASAGDGEQVFTDASGNPLSGEWRYEGVNRVFDDKGHAVAEGTSLGTKGRLCIPSAGIDVAVNRSDESNAQYHADLEDSASYVRYDQGRYYIADHNTQSFAGLTGVSAGDVAYLFTETGIEAFVCTDAFVGHNTGDMLTDGAGHELAAYMPECGFTAYTCLDSWTNIQVTLWKRTWIASTDSAAATAQLTRTDAQSQPMESNDDERAEQRGFIVSIDRERGVGVFEHVAGDVTPSETPLVMEVPQGEEDLGDMQPGSVWADNAGDAAQPATGAYPEGHPSTDLGGPGKGKRPQQAAVPQVG